MKVNVTQNQKNRIMSLQFGGLPVYYGRRVQRGGGILGSIARFFVPAAKKILLPAAKTMLRETMKQAPRVVGSLINNPSTAGKTVLNSLKKAGINTARSTVNQMGFVQKPRTTKRKATSVPKRRRKKQRGAGDIFTI